MEWLKKLLSEEQYNKLQENKILDILKAAMGDMEYIANDPTKIVPKYVFNQKNEELKLLKQKNEAYETQLKDRNGLITDEELKTELSKKDAELATILKQQEQNYKKELELMNKRQLVTNLLYTNGVKDSELLLNVINMDEVIVANDQILNADKLLLPIKEKYDYMFTKNITGQVPPSGNNITLNTKEDLIEKFKKATTFIERENIRREINNIKKE